MDTRSVWLAAEEARYFAEDGLVTIADAGLLAVQTDSQGPTLNVRSIAPSFLLGSRIDPPGEIARATLLEIKRPEGAAMTFRVRAQTILPWRTGEIVEFTSDCASFRPRDRVVRAGACPAAV